MSRTVRLGAVLFIALGGWLTAVGDTAGAAVTNHGQEGSLVAGSVPGGSLGYPLGNAVDNSGGPSDGYIYIGNYITANKTSTVLKFNEDGGYAGVAIDGSNTPQGSLSLIVDPSLILFSPTDLIAVDGSTGPNKGNVYVINVTHGVIDRFSETGQYLCQITGSATPSASECNGAAGSATPPGSLKPSGIEVSGMTGHIFVSDSAAKVIYEFSASGAYVGRVLDAHLTSPKSLALDSTGTMYVTDIDAVHKFNSAGSFVSTSEAFEPTGVAVDQTVDHLYVAQGGFFGSVSEYDASGALVQSFGFGDAKLSVSINNGSGRINAGVLGSLGTPGAEIFGPSGAIIPNVTPTATATAVTETTTSLSGSLTPDGPVASCRFEYGPTLAYGQSAPCVPAPPYAGATAVSAGLSGLTPSTTYHFRLAAKNPPTAPRTRSVPGVSGDGIFITEGHPTVDAQSTSNIERYSATLQATINPHGFDSEFKFEYVDEKHFQESGFSSPATKSTTFSELGGGLKLRNVNQNIANLEINTTYRYRAVAINSRGQGVGATQTFTTLPSATIGLQWAYASLRSARLEAKINPLGFDSSCRVEFVADYEFDRSGYENALSQPCAKGLGVGKQDVFALANLSGLELSTEYHFRFVATNQSGFVTGSDATFSTFGFKSFTVEVNDEEGNPYTQAGGHPYEKIITYRFNHTIVPTKSGSTGSLSAFIKDLLTEQPPGHSGVREEETPKCPGYKAEEDKCSPETKVGTLTIEYFESGKLSTNLRSLYNVVAPDGVASRYATLDPYTASDTSVRTGGDYGTTSRGNSVSEEAKIVGVKVVIWGIPGDHVVSATRSAILRNPTACLGPQIARVRANTWKDPDQFFGISTEIPAVTGCDKLEFHPSIEWRPTSAAAGSPTGLHVGIHQPQNASPDELAFADLKDVVINPAKGLVFNPAGANGLVGCSSAQIGIDNDTAPRCPDAAKIGVVEINTPLVDHPLRGGIYMAAPHDNPFDSLFAIYLAIRDGRSGVVVKLAGEVRADAGDGQLSAHFFENPQLPVEDFKLDFFAGKRAVLTTPSACGTYDTNSTVTPWSAPASGPPAHPTDSYAITSGANGAPCVADKSQLPEKVEFRAGTTAATAGAYAPYVIRLNREDGTQQISDLAVKPPPGLLGRLAGIPRCADSALKATELKTGTEERSRPSCSADSQVGTVVVGAGAGPEPYYVDGKVYLAGPYRGASVSLAVVVPVLAGPFDLGTVVVRSPLRVDLESGQVEVSKESIPTILEGVALDVRTIEVRLDRPRFTLNPTRCDATATTGEVTSVVGRLIALSHPFQVEGCKKLGFAPKVRLRLFGKTHRRAHPTLRAVLTMPEGGANISRVAVAMPPTEFLDNGNIRGICTRKQFAEAACPSDSIYGYAKAWSPLLDQPLEGPVYMRSSTGALPDLVAELNGEFRVAVAGRIDSGQGGIGADIKGLPDVPVSKFVMTIRGGGKGLLQNSVDVCEQPGRGRFRLEGHNGKVVVLHPVLEAKCRR